MDIEKNRANRQTEEDFSLRETLNRYARHKFLFLFTMLIAGAAAIGYLLLSTPLYRIQSSLVIKDEKKGESISLTLKELDFLDEQKIVDNEAEIIRSENIISKVVSRMNLNLGYYLKDRWGLYQPVFESSPIQLEIIHANPELYKEPLIIQLGKDEMSIDPEGVKGRYGDTLTLFGTARIVVKKTSSFSLQAQKVKAVCSDPEATTQQLRKSIAASTPSKNSSVLYVSMLHPSRSRGSAILKEIIQEYDQANIAEKRNQTDSIIILIEDRLALIGTQLKKLENKEESYKEEKGITFLSDDARSYLDQASNNNKELVDAEVQLTNLERIQEYVAESGSVVTPPNTSLNDPVLTNMITQLSQLEMDRQKAERKSGPMHPSVLSLKKQAEEMRSNLKKNIDLQQQGLSQRIQLLRQSQGRLSGSIGKVPASERNLVELMREKSIRENIYSYLLEKREEASLSDASVFSKMRIIDAPYGSIKPVKPKKLVILGMALLAGLLIPIGIITLRDALNRKVNIRYVRENLGFSVMGHIPRMKRFEYVLPAGENIVSEQFRWMRTSIEKGNVDQNLKVILVSSPMDNDGKSFVSLNLAITFARWNRKVVLFDLDLRKQKLSSIYPTAPAASFISLLKGEIKDPAPLIRQIEKDGNVHILSGDMPLEGTQDILHQETLEALFNQLRKEYDYVIVNTPPFLYFTDTFHIESFSDLNLMVVRHRHTRIRLLEDMKHFIDRGSMKQPAVIYNDLPTNELFSRKQLKSYYHYQ